MLRKLWLWGRDVQVNLKDDLLLSRDDIGLNAWYIAVWHDFEFILQTLWLWSGELQVN